MLQKKNSFKLGSDTVLMNLPTFEKVIDLNEGLRFTEFFFLFLLGGEGCLSFVVIYRA